MKRMMWIIAVVILPLIANGQLAWTEHVVDGNAGDPYLGGIPTIMAVDLDQDGDQDVIGYPGYVGFLGRWLNVDGNGEVWEEYSIRGGYNLAEVTDVNGDGSLDMVGIGYMSDHIYWMENIGAPPDQMVYHLIQDNFIGLPNLSVADMDGDGDPDVVSSSNTGPGIVQWWENVDGTGLVWAETTIDNAIEEIWDIKAVDVDGDGDMDVAGVAYNPGRVLWWSNEDGQGQSWQTHLISEEYYGGAHVNSADLDGDGDTDILVVTEAGSHVLYWLQEPNDEWSVHSLNLEELNSFPRPYEVDVADYDGDGDMDIVSGLQHDDRLVLWNNVNGDASVWLTQQVGDLYDGASPAKFVDMNNDGAMDILAGTRDAGQMVWFEQPTDLSITLEPITTTVPANGGAITYNLQLTNDTPDRIRGLTYWTEVLLPDGEHYGPLYSTDFAMPATISIDLTGLAQNVPFYAQPGNYAFVVHVGNMDGFRLTDTFGFTKEDEIATAGMSGWGALGSFDLTQSTEATELSLPTDFSMSRAYPNPFNPTTTVSIDLPEPARLTVSVFNVTGQRVATLANGQFSAGSHSLTFEASTLTSGVYFVHASANGWNDVQKVVLMK